MATSIYPLTFTSSSTTYPIGVYPAPYQDPYLITAEQARRSLGLDAPTIKEKTTVTAPKTGTRLGLAASRPSTHHAARDENLLVSTDAQETIDGWVGQVLVLGAVVWQGEAFPAGAGEDAPDPVAQAIDAARGRLVDVLRGLLGASPATSNPTGFTASSGA